MKLYKALLLAAVALLAFSSACAQKKPEDPVDGVLETGASRIALIRY
jgi:hypothetical protein